HPGGGPRQREPRRALHAPPSGRAEAHPRRRGGIGGARDPAGRVRRDGLRAPSRLRPPRARPAAAERRAAQRAGDEAAGARGERGDRPGGDDGGAGGGESAARRGRTSPPAPGRLRRRRLPPRRVAGDLARRLYCPWFHRTRDCRPCPAPAGRGRRHSVPHPPSVSVAERILFTSESVTEGHPDKIADQISDAVLDAILTDDPSARVACETMVKTGVAIVGGEITTSAWVDLEDLVRGVIKDIGYTSSDVGYDGDTCGVINIIGKQSVDIAQGVDRQKPEDQGAGDQGLMFGYASNETDVLMPAPITFSHRLVQRQAEARKSGLLPWLRPDAKSQVTCRYENGKVVGIDAVVLSTQHDPDVTQEDLKEAVMELIVKHTLPAELLHKDTEFHINPTGKFVIGGPVGDCGLTGRKIIVDTYGGMARHGGGAFSGK